MVGNRMAGARLAFFRGAALGVLLFVVGSGASGCGGQSTGDEEPAARCVELCEKGKRERCPGSEGLMCEESCIGEDARAERAGCHPEYNATAACTAEIDDICDVREDCDAELRDLQDCYEDYCEDATDDWCIVFR